jgi:hypothetical protein
LVKSSGVALYACFGKSVKMKTSSPRGKSVQNVAVIFKTHLDIGFTDFAASVLQKYLRQYIPAALDLARQTRESPHRFVWTTGSWLVHRFLEDASPKERRKIEQAILAGDFHWLALPFTTHTELMDASLFRLGLAFSKRLDERFGRTTVAAKMTDVPGHTRGMVPLLAAAGVRLLHIGVNPASTIPDVPPVFRWRVGMAEIIVIYEKDYGGVTYMPGRAALSVNLTGDNLGPQNEGEIANVFAKLGRRFPSARVQATNLNEVANSLWKTRSRLPVLGEEIGDTWIHGTGTDPGKMARFREICRLRNQWITSRRLTDGGPLDVKFGENLLLVAEHTWGMDIKTHLADFGIYSPAKLQRALGKSNFRAVTASWKEQQAYLDKAIGALPERLRREAQLRLRELNPKRPQAGKRRAVDKGIQIDLAPWRLTLDQHGRINSLIHERTGREKLDVSRGMGALIFQTFSAADYRRFYREYNTWDVEWAQLDFMKQDLPESVPSSLHCPILREAWRQGPTKFGAALDFATEAQELGAPAEVFLELETCEEGIDMKVQWFDKPANRRPEALWLQFAPRLPARSRWILEKVGVPLDAHDVVRDGNRHLHAVGGSIVAGDFSLTSLDAPLVSIGTPQLLRHHNRQPSLTSGVSVILFNNLWGTNFPMWTSDDAAFRFHCRWREDKG